MADRFTDKEIQGIQEDIRKKYDRVALSPRGHFRYPVGIEALERLGYDRELTGRLPREVAESYCGSGNPFSLGDIAPGEQVLDFGCGAGVDTILSAYLTGSSGRVIGVDTVASMLEKARDNARASSCENIDFFLSGEFSDTIPDDYFHVITTNSVINLVPEKEDLLKSFYRFLKPGGRLHIVDQIFTGTTMKEHNERVQSWFQ